MRRLKVSSRPMWVRIDPHSLVPMINSHCPSMERIFVGWSKEKVVFHWDHLLRPEHIRLTVRFFACLGACGRQLLEVIFSDEAPKLMGRHTLIFMNMHISPYSSRVHLGHRWVEPRSEEYFRQDIDCAARRDGRGRPRRGGGPAESTPHGAPESLWRSLKGHDLKGS